jgi:hypothetical protein
MGGYVCVAVYKVNSNQNHFSNFAFGLRQIRNFEIQITTRCRRAKCHAAGGINDYLLGWNYAIHL